MERKTFVRRAVALGESEPHCVESEDQDQQQGGELADALSGSIYAFLASWG